MMNYSLLDKACRKFDELKMRDGTKEKAMPFLEQLANYHYPTLEHSDRVADYSVQIALVTSTASPRDIWLPAILHDIGKLKIPLELLDKTVGWNEKDREKMEKHIEYGCRSLIGLFNFSALTIFYSLYFKREGGYPTDKDFEIIFGDTYNKWHEQNKFKTILCGRWINLADEYDATKTRKNDKRSPGIIRLPTSSEAKQSLIENNQDQIILIDKMYEIGFFN